MFASNSFLEPFLAGYFPWLYHESIYWTVFGVFGNLLFSSRFFIQWLHSERKKQLVVPPIFWHISFWASVMNVIYALHIDKLPIILGTLFLPIIYARNLFLLKKSQGAG